MPPASNNERTATVDETRPPRPAGTSTSQITASRVSGGPNLITGRKACEWLRT